MEIEVGAIAGHQGIAQSELFVPDQLPQGEEMHLRFPSSSQQRQGNEIWLLTVLDETCLIPKALGVDCEDVSDVSPLHGILSSDLSKHLDDELTTLDELCRPHSAGSVLPGKEIQRASIFGTRDALV